VKLTYSYIQQFRLLDTSVVGIAVIGTVWVSSGGGVTIVKVGVQFRARITRTKFPNSDLSPIPYPLDPHETKHCTVFIIVIMTFKRSPAANEIT